MSPHGALRAYTVLLTAEPLRGSPIAHLIQSRYGPHISDVRVGKGAILSPHGALRAYTVLLTAEPLRGSPMVLLLQYRTLSDSSDRSDRSDSSFKPITSSFILSLTLTFSAFGTEVFFVFVKLKIRSALLGLSSILRLIAGLPRTVSFDADVPVYVQLQPVSITVQSPGVNAILRLTSLPAALPVRTICIYGVEEAVTSFVE